MNVFYDDEVDALYLKLGEEVPDGVVELSSGVGIDTTPDGKLVGIEILNASSKMNLTTILTYQLNLEDPARIFRSGKPASPEPILESI